jgi:hypothetical protein
MVTEQERRFADYMTNVKKRYEGKWQRLIGQAIRKDMKPFIETVKVEGALIGLYRLDFMKFPNMIKALNDLWIAIYPVEAERMYRSLKKVKDGLGVPSEDWLEVLRTFLELNVNVRRSIDEIVKQLETLGLNTKRARLIARSESNSAVNAGHYQGAKSQGYLMRKKWIASLDRRTRGAEPQDKTDHYDLNDVEVGIDDFFIDQRSLANMLYPGDSSNGAGAGDIANCRCTVVFVPQRDSEGRLIKT